MTANMLALKSMRMPSATEHATNFELPSEILDLVAEILYDTTCRQLDILLPFSLVSRHFRKSALPFLFGSVSYVVRDRENQKGHELLRLLLDHPHLLRHVHTLHLLRPLDKSDRVSSPDRVPALPRNSDQRNKDLDVIDKALPLMHRLRRIRMDCSAASAYEVLLRLPDDRQYQIILDHLYTSLPWPDLIEATSTLASFGRRHVLGLGAFGAPPFEHPLPTQATFDSIANAAAIDLHMAWLRKKTIRLVEGSSDDDFPSVHLKKTPAWKELRLLVRRASGSSFHSLRDLNMNLVPWHNLQRLSIVWEYSVPLNRFLHDVAPKLVNLQALRMRADYQRIYHPDCRYEMPRQGLFGDPAEVPDFSIDFTQMTELRELEIDGICNHIPITDLVGPKLRSLRLHRDDTLWSVNGLESQRSHSDIIAAAKIAPDMERLELDIGHIERLWHPTAIPGVEVDVEQYMFLNALRNFTRLRFLRLFPTFAPKDSPRGGIYVCNCLPVTDDRAIRIFDHLRGMCPVLQLLSIAAIPSFLNIDTMSWEVSRRGDKNVLTTRHRARNYEHRQIWVGQRRLTSEIKRFSVPQVYLPDWDGWMLTRNDQHDIRQLVQ